MVYRIDGVIESIKAFSKAALLKKLLEFLRDIQVFAASKFYNDDEIANFQSKINEMRQIYLNGPEF